MMKVVLVLVLVAIIVVADAHKKGNKGKKKCAKKCSKVAREQYRVEIETLQGQLDAADAEISNLESEFAGYQAGIETLEGEVNLADTEISNLESELAGHMATIDELNANLATAQDSVSANDAEIAELTAKTLQPCHICGESLDTVTGEVTKIDCNEDTLKCLDTTTASDNQCRLDATETKWEIVNGLVSA
ncbi:unnamed protein product [Owenia fusiformis]|nr:unnamed protein product [Owenia fusiformis]